MVASHAIDSQLGGHRRRASGWYRRPLGSCRGARPVLGHGTACVPKSSSPAG
jgi:hypothetical protein